MTVIDYRYFIVDYDIFNFPLVSPLPRVLSLTTFEDRLVSELCVLGLFDEPTGINSAPMAIK